MSRRIIEKYFQYILSFLIKILSLSLFSLQFLNITVFKNLHYFYVKTVRRKILRCNLSC